MIELNPRYPGQFIYQRYSDTPHEDVILYLSAVFYQDENFKVTFIKNCLIQLYFTNLRGTDTKFSLKRLLKSNILVHRFRLAIGINFHCSKVEILTIENSKFRE